MSLFRGRGRRGRPPHPDVLTPAEWRILAELRQGRSNHEIAEALGLSVNTVRYHVANMLAKLGARDRLELAAWRGEPAAPTRTGLAAPLVWLRDGLSRSWVEQLIVVGGVAVIAAGAWLAFEAVDRGVGEQVTSVAPSATASAAASASPSTTPATVTPTNGEAIPLLMPFSGVNADPLPRSTPTREVSLGTPPPSPFAPYDPALREVVLYDTATLTEQSLGPGGFPRFSPEGSYLAWIVFTDPPSLMEGELHVLNLATGEERILGAARYAQWLADQRVLVFVRGNEMATIDVVTGDYQSPNGASTNPPPERTEAAGLVLEDISPEVTGAPPWRRHYRLSHFDGSPPVVEFEAYRAALAPDGMVALAVAPLDAPIDLPWGTPIEGNIYLADPTTMAATYVATGLLSYGAWPFDVSARYIFWTDDYCGLAARSRLFDRVSGDLIELNDSFWGDFTPSGDLASGPFRAKHIIETETLTYRVSLPPQIIDSQWSPDYRYAATGFEQGHGGACA